MEKLTKNALRSDENLSSIFNYLSNNNLLGKLYDDLNISPIVKRKKNITFESCVSLYNDGGYKHITNFYRKNGSEANWLISNKLVEKFKEATGVVDFHKDSFIRKDDAFNLIVEEFKKNKYVHLNQMSATHRKWLRSHNRIQEFHNLNLTERNGRGEFSLDVCINQYNKCDGYTDFRKKNFNTYRWLYKSKKLDEFKKIIGI